jgi:hypothetical protein
MPLATKNNAIIVKDGKLAEGCGCCGGWYCYDNPCDYTYNGNNALWVCDEPPAPTIDLRFTYSGGKWCQWEFEGGDAKAPAVAVQATYEASTAYNGTFTFTNGNTVIYRPSFSNPAWYQCGYTSPANTPFFQIGAGTPSTGASLAYDIQKNPGDQWEAMLVGGFPLKRYRQNSTAIPYRQWEQSHDACTTSTNGTEYPSSTVGIGARPVSATFPGSHNGAYTDNGPYTAPNPTLSGAKWTFTHPFMGPLCVVEVVQP